MSRIARVLYMAALVALPLACESKEKPATETPTPVGSSPNSSLLMEPVLASSSTTPDQIRLLIAGRYLDVIDRIEIEARLRQTRYSHGNSLLVCRTRTVVLRPVADPDITVTLVEENAEGPSFYGFYGRVYRVAFPFRYGLELPAGAGYREDVLMNAYSHQPDVESNVNVSLHSSYQEFDVTPSGVRPYIEPPSPALPTDGLPTATAPAGAVPPPPPPLRQPDASAPVECTPVEY